MVSSKIHLGFVGCFQEDLPPEPYRRIDVRPMHSLSYLA